MKAVSEAFILALLNAGVPIINRLSLEMHLPGGVVIEKIKAGSISENEVAKAIGAYVLDLIGAKA